MGVRGPLGKPPGQRQRRNKPEELLKLPRVSEAERLKVPALPPRPNAKDGKKQKWSPAVVAWWRAVWRSPMRSQWIEVDARGKLYDILRLRQFLDDCEDDRRFVSLHTTIQKQEDALGLSPLARMRLRWEIPGEPQPEEKPKAEPRTTSAARTSVLSGYRDPRDALLPTSNGAPAPEQVAISEEVDGDKIGHS